MNSIRPSAVAGSFYPAEAEELDALLDECFLSNPLGPRGAVEPEPFLTAGLVPHAGPAYSGPCAAHLYARLDRSVGTVILIGVNHRALGHNVALSPWNLWHTPLGDVRVDEELSCRLEARVDFLRPDEPAHATEHSIEIQLLFLQRALGEFRFLPISLARLSNDQCAVLGRALADSVETDAVAGKKTVILASSDLSHYLSPAETEELDRIALDRVLALDPPGLLEAVDEHNITMCGVLPTAVMLYTAKALGLKRAHLLKHCHSGHAEPMRTVVGYASVAIGL